MSEPLLLEAREVVRDLESDAGKQRILHGVSLGAKRGELLALTGASGSGKSTLLYLLGALDRPSSGAILHEGRDLGALSDDERASYRGRRLGFVFQFHFLLPEFSAEENVMLPMLKAGRPPAEASRLAREAMGAVGLGGLFDRRPSQLSGGQQQRVALARSLANDPVMILADEPTGNLDSSTGREILDLFSELHAQGKTIVMVTHGDEVAARATRVVQMSDGRIVRDVSRAQREMAGA